MEQYRRSIKTIILGGLIYLIFFSTFFKEKVNILEFFDFNKNSWLLVKGNYNDSIQYVIDDNSVLNQLKNKWILYKSNDNFATTGGYNIELFNNSGRVMSMDIINDGWVSKNVSGILSNSNYGTLYYKNLNWIDSFQEKWIKANQIELRFTNIEIMKKHLDSLKEKNNLFILYQGNGNNSIYLKYITYKKN